MVLWRRLGWGAEGFPLMDPPTREKLYEYPLHSQFGFTLNAEKSNILKAILISSLCSNKPNQPTSQRPARVDLQKKACQNGKPFLFFKFFFQLHCNPLQRKFYLTIEFDATTSELLLQTLNDARVHLTDSTLAQVERHADFFHR